tara:strand:+ start:313 stop:648 length:336 start_codon:yes stop_codon:yes gene_type:complete
MKYEKDTFVDGLYYTMTQREECKHLFICQAKQLRRDGKSSLYLDCYKTLEVKRSLFSESTGFNDSVKCNIKHATQEQIHWLNECAKADKFISKEEALKTFNTNVELNYDIY